MKEMQLSYHVGNVTTFPVLHFVCLYIIMILKTNALVVTRRQQIIYIKSCKFSKKVNKDV